MKFEVGETVVYPHHGAAEIIEISEKKIRGEKQTYLTLRVVVQGSKLESGSTPSEGRPSQELIIQVPQDNVEKVGIRDVIDKKGVKQVFDVLRAEFVEEPTNWSRRFKANQEKLASGDVVKVSEIVRDLWRRDQDRGLSAGEKRMLAKARQILVSELALARQVDEDKASAELDKVLAS